MSFVDTNVLVHAAMARSLDHDRAEAAIIGFTVSDRILISRQVTREYVSAVTRSQSWSMPVPVGRVLSNLALFSRIFRVVEDRADAWTRFEEFCLPRGFAGKQVYDAYLVASMPASGAKRLLTFNLKHFRRFAH